MSIISTSYTTKSYSSFESSYVKKTKAADHCTNAKTESVVDKYKRKHPEDAAHVEKQLQAGKAARMKNGAGNVSTEDMTMEEYQAYFYALLNTVPYDSTRINDDNFLSISDAGWEQMKKDPDYEAWILGYFVEDRAVRNPFYGWGGNTGCIVFEHFGASIEEHHGEGFSKSAWEGKKDKSEDEESWWSKRHKRMEEIFKEQMAAARKQAKAKHEAAQSEYRNHQLASQQRLQSFLAGKPYEKVKNIEDIGQTAVIAQTAYMNIMDLFGSSIGGNM